MSRSTIARAKALPALVTAFANSDRLPVSAGMGTDMPIGQIHNLANSSRFDETYFSEPLTTFATGYKDPNDIQAALEFLAPVVPTGGRFFEWKKWSNAEEFYSEVDDIRSIGADFKRVEYTGIDQTAKSLNKGLIVRVDLDNAPDGWENRTVGKLLRRLWRNEFRRAQALVAASAVTTAKVWNAAADPEMDVINEGILGANQQGFQFNRVMFGHSAWALRLAALRGNNNAAKFATAGFTPEELAGYLNVDGVYVSKERYQSSGTAKSEIIGNSVLMHTAMAGQDIEDPSNIKRFTSPVLGGGAVRVYQQQISAKLVDIVVEHYSIIIATSTLGIRQFTVTSS